MTKDEKVFTDFLDRNLPAMAPTFDEGIGIASDRYFMDRLVGKIMRSRNIKTVLEAPADCSMGIPGMSSICFVRRGAKLAFAGPHKPFLENSRKFWNKLGLGSKVKFIFDPNYKFPFKNDSYDLVWNYCVFEHFKNTYLLEKMQRISKKWVFVIVQNRYNWGFPIHLYFHRKNSQKWDHGYKELMDKGYVEKLFRKAGMKIDLSGFIDIPPWLDTFDMHTRGLGKKLVKGDDKWYWSSLQKGDIKRLSESRLINILDIFQKMLFFPFNFLFAHHFYILASKNN